MMGSWTDRSWATTPALGVVGETGAPPCRTGPPPLKPRCCCSGCCSGAGGRRSPSPPQDSSPAPEATPPRLLLLLLLGRRGPATSQGRRARWRCGWSGRRRSARPCGAGWPTAAPCTAATYSTPSTASDDTVYTARPCRCPLFPTSPLPVHRIPSRELSLVINWRELY
jgi:hypothetical protein